MDPATVILLHLSMLILIPWGIFRFVAARGGSAWHWALISACGYLATELFAWYDSNVGAKEYFLQWWPAGTLWVLLFLIVLRIHFRGRAVQSSP